MSLTAVAGLTIGAALFLLLVVAAVVALDDWLHR